MLNHPSLCRALLRSFGMFGRSRLLEATSLRPLVVWASRPGKAAQFRGSRLAGRTAGLMLLELPALGRRQGTQHMRHPTARTYRGLHSRPSDSFLL